MGTITQKDIAHRLGVTRVLVSRALAGHDSVAERTQQLVRETALEMGYTQNSNFGARAMAMRRNGQVMRYGAIACVLGSPAERTQLSYWAQLQQGIEEAAQEAGYRVVLVNDERDCEATDGLIVHGGARGEASVPVVSLMEVGPETPGVVADNFGGARDLTEQLLQLGHTRIGCLMNTTGSTSVQARVRGWKAALRRAGVALEKEWLREMSLDGGYFLERGRANLEAWLADGFRELGLTALLVQNDRAAIGAMQALQEAGVGVPEDISIAGFDGTGEGDYCRPSLTTVEVPLRRAGREGVELLLQLINGQSAATRTLPCRVVLRESTAKPYVAGKPRKSAE